MSSASDLAAPYPGTWTVRQALAAYLAENGFSEASYEEPWTNVSFFGLHFQIPNTKSHQRALRLHDLHHVATGFGTDLVGEGEVSAMELRHDLPKAGAYVAFLVLGVAATGLLLSPSRIVSAFRDSKSTRCLWGLDVPYEQLLEMRVSDLRKLVGVPSHGSTQIPRKLHPQAPRASPLAESWRTMSR